jgi:butyryl-CoA dehydrogenase
MLTFNTLPEEVKMVRDMARQFAETELYPVAGHIDMSHEYPASQVAQLADLGLMGIMVPEQYGGAEMSSLAYAVALEEISRGCASTGVIMSANNSLYCAPVLKYGTDAQKEHFLKPYAQGQQLGCFGLSEPGNGSDAGAASTTAVEDGPDHFIVNGTKAWITNAHEASCAIVFATTDKSLKHKVLRQAPPLPPPPPLPRPPPPQLPPPSPSPLPAMLFPLLANRASARSSCQWTAQGSHSAPRRTSSGSAARRQQT